MNKKRRVTVYQHEPLITPPQWRGDELQFAIRLTQLVDDLYQKYGALKEENNQLKKRIEELEAANA